MERLDIVNEDIKLFQNLSGLTYGTDALLLSAFIRGGKGGRAVEFGAGTGIISLLCAKRRKFDSICAVEVQPEYAELCRRNIEANGFEGHISVLCADVQALTQQAVGGQVDAVFANPPYIKQGTGVGNADRGKYIARHEVLGGAAEFSKAASRLLKHGGAFYVVYRPDRLDDLMLALRQNSLAPKRMTLVYGDAQHDACLVLVEAKKSGGAGIFVTKPLLIKDNGADSADMRYIYENGEFHERFRKK